MKKPHQKWKKSFLYITILVILIYTIQVASIFQLPSQLSIFKGDIEDIDILFPFTLEVLENKNNILNLNSDNNLDLLVKNSYKIKSNEKGKANLNIKILGLLPVKSLEVNVVDRIKLVPGGHSIGVKLSTDGVLVVAISEIEGIDNKIYTPAKDANIKVGDSILEINNIVVKDSFHVIDILDKVGHDKIKVKVRRDNKEFITYITPIKSKEDNSYRMGLWVRDKTAGIGTLTFYDPITKKFAALGHGISDIDTGKILAIRKGQILEASISSIEQGKKGSPGELRGMFFETQNILGDISKNTNYGIYGIMAKKIKNPIYNKAIPIGLQHEIKKGKAYILSTINGQEIQKYEVEIVKLQRQIESSPKGMIVKVVDKKLLTKTGGIVQGMSGSPIIQEGKIIGAVTHVFVNDPTKGYGLYIEWMLENADIINNNIGYLQKIK